jgi:hypothetical protein
LTREPTPQAAKIILNLNRIHVLATNDLMMGRARSPETQRWLQILRERASNHVMSIILHPDYKPPITEPPPPPPKN